MTVVDDGVMVGRFDRFDCTTQAAVITFFVVVVVECIFAIASSSNYPPSFIMDWVKGRQLQMEYDNLIVTSQMSGKKEICTRHTLIKSWIVLCMPFFVLYPAKKKERNKV